MIRACTILQSTLHLRKGTGQEVQYNLTQYIELQYIEYIELNCNTLNTLN